jgi:hypothetical protein
MHIYSHNRMQRVGLLALHMLGYVQRQHSEMPVGTNLPSCGLVMHMTSTY